jgi:DNA polymerase-3 subunit alpha
MAFVTIEDLQGSVELVIFPKVWAKVATIIAYDRVILVHGRAAGDGGEAKVLVDSISTDFKMAAQNGQSVNAAPQFLDSWETEGSFFIASDAPLPPEPFPPDLDIPEMTHPSIAIEGIQIVENYPVEAAPQSRSEELSTPNEISNNEGEEIIADVPPATIEDETPIESQPEVQLPPALGVLEDSLPGEIESELPPFLVPPISIPARETTYMVTVILRASNDKARDILRIRRLHGTIMSYPGKDRFAFHVFEQGKGYLLEFPNDTTGMCPELVSRLQEMVGGDNVRVEPITYL